MLQLIDISKTFNPGTVNEKKALSHLNLELQDGDFATIIGSNGAGKSTMFNAICGTFFVDEGAVILDGRDITYEKEHKRSKYIGHLFQDPMKGTAPNMSIEENLALAYLRATVVTPKILLLDEHTAALDPATAEKVLNLTKRIVAENKITCLMITHNMQSALDLGNRTLMMNSGEIVLDVKEEERKGLTVADLLEKFKEGVGAQLDNDRILLS